MQRRDFLHRLDEIALGLLQIVSHLHPQLNIRSVPTQFAQPHRHLGRNGRTFGENGMQRLARDAQLCRSGRHRQPQGRQNILAEQLSGVTRPPGRRPFDFEFRHFC